MGFQMCAVKDHMVLLSEMPISRTQRLRRLLFESTEMRKVYDGTLIRYVKR
jgi:hypothetical protein